MNVVARQRQNVLIYSVVASVNPLQPFISTRKLFAHTAPEWGKKGAGGKKGKITERNRSRRRISDALT